MSELFPLEAFARTDAGQDAANARAITLSERRPGSFVEIAIWSNGKKTATAISKETGIKGLPGLGHAMTSPGNMLLAIGPGRYLAISQDEGLAQRLSAKVPVGEGVIVDLTHGRVGIRISGSPAQALLQKGLSLDLDVAAFPAMAAASSAIHHMGITVVRIDETCFDVFAMTSFAGSLWEWVTDAAVEYGWQVSAPIA